jgi:hypothetical protein
MATPFCTIPRTSDTEPAIELRLFSDRSRNIRRPINDRCRARHSRFDPTQSCYAFAALRIPALLIPSCVPTHLAAQGPNRIMGAA